MYDYIFNYSLENFSLKPDSTPPYNNVTVVASLFVSFVKIKSCDKYEVVRCSDDEGNVNKQIKGMNCTACI